MSDREDVALGRIKFDPETGITVEQVRQLREGTRHREESALALYRAMQESGELPGRSLVTYRCHERGCLLLDVFPTPHGPGVYLPAFRLSPRRNADTHPDARARRTSDGERRWHERADLLDTDPPAGLGVEYWAQCDHLLDHPVPAEQVNRDLVTRRGEVVLLPVLGVQ